MIRSGGWSDWFSESGRLGTRGSLFLVTLLVLFSMPLCAGSSNDFAIAHQTGGAIVVKSRQTKDIDLGSRV